MFRHSRKIQGMLMGKVINQFQTVHLKYFPQVAVRIFKVFENWKQQKEERTRSLSAHRRRKEERRRKEKEEEEAMKRADAEKVFVQWLVSFC